MPAAEPDVASMLAAIRAPLRAIAVAVAPAMAALDEAEWAEAEDHIALGVAARPPAVRRQIGLFVRLVNVFALVRYGRPLARLSIDRRQALLRGLERAPLLLLRRAVWGVRTLAYMGYYCQERGRRDVGYAGHRDGWRRQDTTAGPWPTRVGGTPEPDQPGAPDGEHSSPSDA